MLTYRDMRKKHRKLKLTAESLRNLSHDVRVLARVAGGRPDDEGDRGTRGLCSHQVSKPPTHPPDDTDIC